MAHKEKRKARNSDDERRLSLRKQSDKSRLMFEEFVNVCIPLVKIKDQSSVRDFLWTRYNNAKPHYTKSREFHITIDNKYKELRTTKKSVYVHVYEICNLLKAYRCKTHKKVSDSEDSGQVDVESGEKDDCKKHVKDKERKGYNSKDSKALQNSTTSADQTDAKARSKRATYSETEKTATSDYDTASEIQDGVFVKKENNCTDSAASDKTSSDKEVEIISVEKRSPKAEKGERVGLRDHEDPLESEDQTEDAARKIQGDDLGKTSVQGSKAESCQSNSDIAMEKETEGESDLKGDIDGCFSKAVTGSHEATPRFPSVNEVSLRDNSDVIAAVSDDDVHMESVTGSDVGEVFDEGGILEGSAVVESCQPSTEGVKPRSTGGRSECDGSEKVAAENPEPSSSMVTSTTQELPITEVRDPASCLPSTSHSSDQPHKPEGDQSLKLAESAGTTQNSSSAGVVAMDVVVEETARKRDREELNDQPSSSSSLQKGDEPEKKKRKTASASQIKRLEKLLKEVSDEIKRLQERELSLDELDQEDSDHIQEHRLKKRFMKIWNKLCELKGVSAGTGRAIEKRITFEGTRYQEMNKKIEKFVNKHGFPDYHDILGIVKKVNKKKQMNLKPKLINETAVDAFRTVGNLLQKRREADYILNFGTHLTDTFKPEYDPAKQDQELHSKLKSNRSVAKRNIDAVIMKYKEKQYELDMMGRLVDDGSDTEKPGQDEEDEEKMDEKDDFLSNLQSPGNTEGETNSPSESKEDGGVVVEDDDGDESDQSVQEIPVTWDSAPDNSDNEDGALDARSDAAWTERDETCHEELSRRSVAACSTVVQAEHGSSVSDQHGRPGFSLGDNLEKLVCKSKAEVVLRKLDWQTMTKVAKKAATTEVDGIVVKTEDNSDLDYKAGSSTFRPSIFPPEHMTSSCLPSKSAKGSTVPPHSSQGFRTNVRRVKTRQWPVTECIVISDSDD